MLDALVQSRRDRRAAERLLRKLIRKQARIPRVLITDRLGSYGAVRKDMCMKFEHRQHKGLTIRQNYSNQATERISGSNPPAIFTFSPFITPPLFLSPTEHMKSFPRRTEALSNNLPLK